MRRLFIKVMGRIKETELVNRTGIRNSRESLLLLCLEEPREEDGRVEAESVDVTAGESCPVGPVVS